MMEERKKEEIIERFHYVFDQIQQLLIDDREKFNIPNFIYSAAKLLATAITPNNEQFVVMDILAEEAKYKIIFGEPKDSKRHGYGSEGDLEGRTALLNAINNKRIEIIQDATTDPRVDYMNAHVIAKNIHSLVVIPVVRRKTEYLIVIDRASGAYEPFNEEEIEEIEKISRQISATIKMKLDTEKRIQKEIEESEVTIFDALEDRVKHSMLDLTLNVREILQFIEGNTGVPKEIKGCTEKARKSLAGLEGSFNSLKNNMHLLLSSEENITKVRVVELLNPFRLSKKAEFFIQSDPQVENQKIKINRDVILTAFSDLCKFIEVNGDDDPYIEVRVTHEEIFFTFRNGGFRPIKIKRDMQLFLIKNYIEKCRGTFSIPKEELIITLPRKSYSANG